MKSGGKLLGTGSGSCVFTPDLPCKGKKTKRNDKRVSKYIFNESAIKLLKDEQKIVTKIKKIKNYEDWCIIFDNYCEPEHLDKLYGYEPKGFDECFKESSISDTYYDHINKHSYLTSGPLGGITFEDYFIDNYYNVTDVNIEKKFIELMNMMKPLFEGLKIMEDKKIIHNDIKGLNIVKSGDVFKYIDFGLSGTLSQRSLFRNRGRNEFNTSRIYIYYPLDYIYFYATNSELEDEKYKINKNDVRYHFDDLYDYYNSLFNLDFYEVSKNIINDIQSKKLKDLDVLKKVDVYSVGSLVPLLFMYESKIEFPNTKSEKINDYYNLFKDMTNPYCEQRISANEAYERFNRLLNNQGVKNNNQIRIVSRKNRQKTIKQKRRLR